MIQARRVAIGERMTCSKSQARLVKISGGGVWDFPQRLVAQGIARSKSVEGILEVLGSGVTPNTQNMVAAICR
jgi:hypothetical protein